MVENAEVCGMHIATGASVHATVGTVSGAAIGACIQSAAQDLATIQEAVRYEDHGRNLDSTSLPVPMPLENVASE